MSDIRTRREPRLVSAERVEVRLENRTELETLWIRDISRGGMFVRTASPPAIGARLEVILSISNGELALAAEVAHVVDATMAAQTGHPPGAGLRFLPLPPEKQRALEAHIAGVSEASHGRPGSSAGRAAPLATSASTEWMLGIDLGTMNTAAVAVESGGSEPVSIFRSRLGRGPILPSVVCFADREKPVLGWDALDRTALHPRTTIFGWKRFLGRSEKSEFVVRNRERFPYAIRANERRELGAGIGSDVIPFVEIARILLEEVRVQAQVITGRELSDCVITVPAHFGTAQRRAVCDACGRASLRVRRIVNEPTAAALSFAMDRRLESRILVYDFGGGTFDATILELVDNVFDVKTSSGDTFLGGLDFDRAIANRLLDVLDARGKIDPEAMPETDRLVLDAAERAKIALSDADHTVVHIPKVGTDRKGRALELKYKFTRSELERLTAPLVERTIGIVEETMRAANIRKSDIEQVILVGGQARMPLVLSRLEQTFGRPAVVHPFGDTSVARGAAIAGHGITDLAGAVLIDVLSVPIGMMSPGGQTQWVFERGTTLPAARTIAVAPARPGTECVVGLWEGTDLTASDRQMLGVIRIPVELATSGQALPIEVRLSEDLELSAFVRLGGGARTLAVERPA